MSFTVLVIANHWIATDDQSRFVEQSTSDLLYQVVPLSFPPSNVYFLDVEPTYTVMEVMHEETDHVDVPFDMAWSIYLTTLNALLAKVNVSCFAHSYRPEPRRS